LTVSVPIYLAMAALIYHFWTPRGKFGWANRITLARAVLAISLAALLHSFARDTMWPKRGS